MARNSDPRTTAVTLALKIPILVTIMAVTALWGHPILNFEANQERNVPETWKLSKPAIHTGIKWAEVGNGTFAIDTDGMPRKGAPLTWNDARMHQLCTKNFTVELQILPRMRRNNPRYGEPDHHWCNEVILNLGNAGLGQGFFIRIFERDLSFGVRMAPWTSQYVNWNVGPYAGKWLELAFVYHPDDHYMAIYMDGRQISLKQIDGRGHACKQPLWIGGDSTDWSFDGLIGKIMITPRAKTPQELSHVEQQVKAGAKILEAL